MTTERAVPESRLSRMTMIGRLVGGIAGGAVTEGARQLARGERPSLGGLLLGPGNVEKLAERLSEMRGAAMKVGQLLSMDSGHLLPRQLSVVLAKLREDAHRMPLGQVAQVLNTAWGKGWETGFRRFSFTPLAAASIGQVHEALLKDGRRLAVKVQYPGIRRSIDSDVDNVAALLRLFSLLPNEIDFHPLLEEAKRQLHIEADYTLEAEALTAYSRRLQGDARFATPEVVESLTTSEVLAMSYMEGHPIEHLDDLGGRERNRVAAALLELAMREVLEWGVVQTDPNFANYLYEPRSGRIQLLDFGATRSYPPERREALRRLLRATSLDDAETIVECAIEVGYLDREDGRDYRAFVIDLLRMVTEPLKSNGDYEFGDGELARKMSERLVDMRLRSRIGRLPPPDILFLHRKLGGLYLLLTRLGARVPVRSVVEPFLARAFSSRAFKRIYSPKTLSAWAERNACPENDRLCGKAVWLFQSLFLGGTKDMDDIAAAIAKIQARSPELAKRV